MQFCYLFCLYSGKKKEKKKKRKHSQENGQPSSPKKQKAENQPVATVELNKNQSASDEVDGMENVPKDVDETPKKKKNKKRKSKELQDNANKSQLENESVSDTSVGNIVQKVNVDNIEESTNNTDVKDGTVPSGDSTGSSKKKKKTRKSSENDIQQDGDLDQSTVAEITNVEHSSAKKRKKHSKK